MPIVRSMRARAVFLAAGCVAMALTCAPAAAVGPLALLGKEIVQGLIRSLVEDALQTALIAALGPCDAALASGTLSTVQAVTQMRGGAGMTGLPGSMPVGPGMPGLPGAGSAAGTAMGPGTMGSVASSMQRVMGAQMAEMREQEQRERRDDQRRRGLSAAQIEAEDREDDEAARDMERNVQAMREARPLSDAELDEFVTAYSRLASLQTDAATCSPESLKRLLTLSPAASMPMVAGPIRMMLDGFRAMDKGFAEARQTYAAMTATERREHVELMLDDLPHWSPEERKWFAALYRSDQLGMPADMREAFAVSLR